MLAPSAKADYDAIRNADSAVWISGGADFFGYKESVPPPDLADSERNAIASIASGASLLAGEEDIYVALEGSVSFGNTSYKGSYFYYPTTPAYTTTNETISNIDAKLGKGFLLTDDIMVIPYAELGYRYWQRNVGGAGAQEEDYQNYEAQAGAMLQYAPFTDLVFTLYGSGGTTMDPKMKTGGYTFGLGSAPLFETGGKIGYNVTEHFEIFTTADYEHLAYNQSSPEGGAYEPSSNTNEMMVRAGVAYHFW